MRILIFSDTHGEVNPFLRIVEQQPADLYLHLGDGAAECEAAAARFPDKKILGVCGNCDVTTQFPEFRLVKAFGVKLLMVHGHTLGVKSSLAPLWKLARAKDASIALYGHTHKSSTIYQDGVHFCNPGSLARPYSGQPSYGAIDITGQGILCHILKAGGTR